MGSMAIRFSSCSSTTLIALGLFGATLEAAAQAIPTNSAPASPPAVTAKIPDATTAPVRVTNAIVIGGVKVGYTAETGMLPVLKADGSSRASIFYTAYTRLGETNHATRPVMFCFNGGPGSASVWLQLGALGPRRVQLNADGSLPAPPFALLDNEFSVLDATDLVFIDPVATGFSRATKEDKAEEFFGDEGDLNSVGEFIRLWCTRHDRWVSPKFLCGESYGVFRAAGLADHLRDRCGMYLNGLVLVSGVLDFGTIRSDLGNDLPFALILPAYTAAAHFHKKLPADLQADLDKALAEARAFAQGEFTTALHAGAALEPAAQKKIVAELARLTGLAPAVIEDNNLRVNQGVFRKQLLRAEGLVLGAYDARLTGRDGRAGASWPGFDPSAAAVFGPFSACMNAYVRGELKFENDLPYEFLKGMPSWSYNVENSFPNAGERLATAMNLNPHLKILVLGGRCDLVCPIAALHHSLDHLPLAAAYRTNISYAEFDAGHMMYINLPDLQKWRTVVGRFVRP